MRKHEKTVNKNTYFCSSEATESTKAVVQQPRTMTFLWICPAWSLTYQTLSDYESPGHCRYCRACQPTTSMANYSQLPMYEVQTNPSKSDWLHLSPGEKFLRRPGGVVIWLNFMWVDIELNVILLHCALSEAWSCGWDSEDLKWRHDTLWRYMVPVCHGSDPHFAALVEPHAMGIEYDRVTWGFEPLQGH